MKVFGLTGGIASGKSTVRRMFEKLGAKVLDADALYHHLLLPHANQPSPLATEIGQLFPGVLEQDGTINRKELGARAFVDAQQREKLEKLTHPKIAQAFTNAVVELERSGVERVIYDVPLLYEKQLDRGMQGVIVVWVPADLQRQRLRLRDGLSDSAIDARIVAQLSLDEKRRRATWVIDNSGSVTQTEEQVRKIYQELQDVH